MVMKPLATVSLEDDYQPAGEVNVPGDSSPMGAVLNAALQCREAGDVKRHDEDADAVSDAMEGLEALRVSVESIHAQGAWNVETAKLSHLAADGFIISSGLACEGHVLAAAHAMARALPGESAGQSREDADRSAQATLESLDDILQVMSDHVSAGFGRLKQSLLSALGNLAANLPTLEDKWRKMDRRLHDEAHDPEGEVSASGLVKRFQRQGVFPDDLESYLKEYAEHVLTIAVDFDHHAKEAVVKNADLLARIEFDSNNNYDQTYDAAAKAWSDPRGSLPERLFDFIVPGGEPFFMSLSTTYKGENKSIQHFDQYATKHVPTRGRWGFSIRKVEALDRIPSLRISTMRELTKHFLDVTEKVKLEFHEHGEALAHAQVKAEYFDKRKAEADKDVKAKLRESYKYIDKAYGVTYEMGQYFKYNTLHQFVNISNALLTYMQRSLKPLSPKPESEDKTYN